MRKRNSIDQRAGYFWFTFFPVGCEIGSFRNLLDHHYGESFYLHQKTCRRPLTFQNSKKNKMKSSQTIAYPISQENLIPVYINRQKLSTGIFNVAVIVAALGYFVDVYDLVLFNV